jgi:hypothetical protein
MRVMDRTRRTNLNGQAKSALDVAHKNRCKAALEAGRDRAGFGPFLSRGGYMSLDGLV